MAEISQPVIAASDVAASLHSELGEIVASSADLDSVAESASLDLAMASSPSLSSSCVPLVYNTGSSVSDSMPCHQLPATVSVVVTSGSPTALATSCSSTPPTPQSHGSGSSPGLHSDRAVTVPPPPYSATSVSTELTATVTVPAADSLAQSDPARLHFPPPPKKPLTPYMRFSKSVSDRYSVT